MRPLISILALLLLSPQLGAFSDSQYQRHYLKLKKQVPPGFHIVLQKPFFVIGNGDPQILRDRWARGTVAWATAQLKKLYFKKDPNDIIDIWLFKDRASYLKYNRLLWQSRPDTPYGYYSPSHKVLVMNIATGGGTLVHEIVHPFMATNFTKCPDWFNEGMGSLYEQSTERGGRIFGLTNWRLAGLQQAIKSKSLPGFYKMMTAPDFYGQPDGYSQARYLLYYLQSKNLMVKYYHTFRQNVDKDPSGYYTLLKILKIKDIKKFERQWQSWVLKLRFG